MPPVSTRVLFLYANQPDALTTRKMELIDNLPCFEVTVLYWDRMNVLSIPFSTVIPDARVVRVIKPDVGSSRVRKIIRRASVIIKMTAKLLHARPHIVSAGSLDVLVAVVLAKIVSTKKFKVLYDLADTDDWMLLRPVIALQRKIFCCVDQFLITSKRYEDGFLKRFNLNPDSVPVAFVPNSPPKRFFDSFVPRSWNENIVISYIGTFRGARSIFCLVQAVEQARGVGLDVKILFAGTGPERALVERYSREHDFVRYYGPYNYSKEISRIYSETNIVYACYDDSHNKKIALACRFAEAIVCGIPLIVSKGTYMAELTEQHGFGYTVGPNDVSALVEIFRVLIRTAGEREKIRSNCNKVRYEYFFDSYEPELEGIYQTLSKSVDLKSQLTKV